MIQVTSLLIRTIINFRNMIRLLLILSLSVMIISCNKKVTDNIVEDRSSQSLPDDKQQKVIKPDVVEHAPEEVAEEPNEIQNKDKTAEILRSPYTRLELDIFGNKYIYSNIELIKLDAKNDTIAVFNTRNTSSISSVAVTNPNKVIVYSRDNQRTWTLDSTLSVIEDKRIDLPELGEIGFVTRLEGDDVLYYSRSSKKFYRTNSNNNKIIESDVQWKMESQIKDIIESQDLFIVRNEQNEIYLFDSFGNLIRQVRVAINDGPVDFQNNFIYQIEGNQLRYLDLTDPTGEFKEYKLANDLKNVSDFKMARQKVYTLTNGKVAEQKIMIVNY